MPNWPQGIVTKKISAGKPYILETGKGATVTMRVKASRGLTWNGDPLLSVATVVGDVYSDEVELELPVCDQAGMRDEQGNLIELANGAITHTYEASLVYRDRMGEIIATRTRGPFAIRGADPAIIDLDALADVSPKQGQPIYVPDTWDKAVADAVSATNAAKTQIKSQADTAVAQFQAVLADLPGSTQETLLRDAEFGHIQHRQDTTDYRLAAVGVIAETGVANAATADGKAVAAQTTADTGVTNAATADGKAADAQTTATKALGKQGTVNLTNSGEWPFNTSGTSVTLNPAMANTNYIITTEVTAANGEVGSVNITDKTASGFKLSYTGSAKAVTIRWHVVAE
jgi:hypothetical protein